MSVRVISEMKQDEKFCLCREIVRIVKKDPYYMWC